MLKKAMIQFISALTLILGTVFPSTSALATTSVEPVAINSARLVTSDDQVIGDRVKSGTDAIYSYR
ncbi:hypothetical protein [Secundilactobacillus kimchicus]|uniref:hypothetical protein n=1 Tax=Secundilactobacillus kimchicus TaxID=528209 RepID=UPI0006D13688|nr:hypothetical protein [Secundilactobacillus kimchicus]